MSYHYKPSEAEWQSYLRYRETCKRKGGEPLTFQQWSGRQQILEDYY